MAALTLNEAAMQTKVVPRNLRPWRRTFFYGEDDEMEFELTPFRVNEYWIRPITIADAAAFYEIVSSEAVRKTLAFEPVDIEQCERMIRVVHLSYRMKCLPQTMVIVLNDKMIGLLNVNRYEEELMELGYFLHPDYFRKGIMKQVIPKWIDLLIHQFAIHRFEAYCEPWNIAGNALLTSIGFHKEGCLKQLVKGKDGSYHDMNLYAYIVEK